MASRHARARSGRPRRPAAPAAGGSGAGGCLRDGRRARHGGAGHGGWQHAAGGRRGAGQVLRHRGHREHDQQLDDHEPGGPAVRHGDPGQRDEVGHHRAVQRVLQLRPGRRDRVVRQGARHAGARAQPGLAEPAAVVGVQPAAEPGAAGDGKPHHHGGQPLQGRDLRLGRRQRAVQRRRQLRQRRVLPGDGQRVHRRRAAHRARRRPRRPAVPQRLQHRGRERQEQRHVQPGAVPAGPGGADQRRGL